MLTINWSDINLNGMPAIQRTLETVVKAVNAIESRHSLELHRLEDRVRRLESGEGGAVSEIVEELGHGWRIERQQAAPNADDATSGPPGLAGTTVEDIDRQMAGVGHALDAFHRHFVHSPGYPQSEEE
jgi:hypothetical protein